MNRTALNEMSPGRSERIVYRVFFALFLLAYLGLWISLWPACRPLARADWLNTLLVSMAAVVLLTRLCRQLPIQNVLLAAAVLGTVPSAFRALGLLPGVLLGPPTAAVTGELSHRYSLSWLLPLEWIVAILTSRGVAQLALRCRHNTPNYGLRMILLTTVLAIWLGPGLELLSDYGAGDLTSIRSHWQRITWMTCVGLSVTALLTLVLATPALIDKKGDLPAPDYHPLLIWLLCNLLFAGGCAAARMWLLSVLFLMGTVVATLYAVRGARTSVYAGLSTSRPAI